jgi:hypothetical protein
MRRNQTEVHQFIKKYAREYVLADVVTVCVSERVGESRKIVKKHFIPEYPHYACPTHCDRLLSERCHMSEVTHCRETYFGTRRSFLRMKT